MDFVVEEGVIDFVDYSLVGLLETYEVGLLMSFEQVLVQTHYHLVVEYL